MNLINAAIPVAKDYLTCGPLLRSMASSNWSVATWASSSSGCIFANGLIALSDKSKSLRESIGWIFYTIITTNLTAQAISSIVSDSAGVGRFRLMGISVIVYSATQLIDSTFYKGKATENLTGGHISCATFSSRIVLHQIYVLSTALIMGGCVAAVTARH